ncbi:hypothetical protein R1sor_026664 [Riccia sorocarpa]|uniref:Uncharacterized protein n=1 Tax=Riccia sorocarpa TaxID=122646 RepID=A0ABD3GDI4_9MARC
MSGYERNYDFADLIDCASGLNRLAAMEYGEENLQMGKTHAKQQTIWGKLHPLVAGESEANLSDFTGLRSDAEFVDALKKGLQEAQGLLILLNMAPHTGVRDQTWWKAPWASEKDLGVFAKANDAGGSDSEEDDGADDLAVIGHEARHVMSEVLQQVCSEEEVTKFDPLVAYDGHSIYKATLVSQLVGNPTLSKDRLTRIKQSIYFNGVKYRPRADGVPVCILDIGSDCAVLFDTENRSQSTRSKKGRGRVTVSKDVWIGRAQKIRRRYNGPECYNGASHSETEEFRVIKINNKNFSQYRAGDFLMETVETNAQRKLVNGQPYEEISYYKDAAPYGSTYFLMNVIAELFWCNGRSTRFTTPMVYAYMRSLHGFQTNWAKKRARTPDNSKVTPVIWTPVFVKILYAYRETVFAGTPLAAADSWVPWVHLSKEGDIDIRILHAKFPTPIEDLKVIRDSCKLSDNIPIAEPVNGDARDVPTSTPTKIAPRKRSREVQDLDDEPIPQPKSHSSGSPDRQVRTRYTKRRNVTVGARNDPGTSIVPYDDIADGKRTVEPIFDDFGTKLGVIFGELASRKLEEAFWPMLADSKATEALKDQLADKCAKMQEAERQRADLNDQLTALKASLLRNNEKAAKQLQTELDQVRTRVAEGETTISKLETDLQVARQDVSTRDADRETLKAEVKSLRGQLEASKIATAAKQAKLEHENSDLQEQVQREKRASERFKEALQADMKKHANLEEQVLTLNGLIEGHKFTLDRAEKALAASRSELAIVKTDLRMLQISGK